MELQASIWQDDQGTHSHGGPTLARLVKELRVTIENPVMSPEWSTPVSQEYE